MRALVSFLVFSFIASKVSGQLKLLQANRGVGEQEIVYCQTNNLFSVNMEAKLVTVIPSVGRIVEIKNNSFIYRLDAECFSGKVSFSVISTMNNKLDTSEHVYVFERDFEHFPIYDFGFASQKVTFDTVKKQRWYMSVSLKQLEKDSLDLVVYRNGKVSHSVFYSAVGLVLVKNAGKSNQLIPSIFGTMQLVCGTGMGDVTINSGLFRFIKRMKVLPGDRIFISDFRVFDGQNGGQSEKGMVIRIIE